MHAGVAMNAKPEPFLGIFIEHAFTKFHDILLQRFVTRWVIENLPDDSRISWPQDIVLRDPNQVANLKT